MIVLEKIVSTEEVGLFVIEVTLKYLFIVYVIIILYLFKMFM